MLQVHHNIKLHIQFSSNSSLVAHKSKTTSKEQQIGKYIKYTHIFVACVCEIIYYIIDDNDL